MNASPALLGVKGLRIENSSEFNLTLDALAVAEGETLAIVGANGAGKTSLLESLIGLRSRADGEIAILGHPLASFQAQPELRRKWGCLLQRNSYANAFKVAEIVALHRALYGPSDPALFGLLTISELERLTYSKLSGGQRQRVDLLVALQHEPQIALLDEPTTGLDRRYAASLLQFLKNRTSRNPRAATIFSSHKAEELEIASRVMVVENGRMTRDILLPHQLRAAVGSQRLDLRFPTAEPAVRAEAELQSDTRIVAAVRDGTAVRIFAADDISADMLERYGSFTENFAFGPSDAGDILTVAIGGGNE